MKKKVTLIELMVEQVILALLLVVYYWMWARTDWQSYYDTLQNCIAIFVILFFVLMANRIRKYNKEVKDEFAITNLRRCDSIAMKFFIVVSILAAFLSVLSVVDNRGIGYMLVGSVAVSMIIRLAAFAVMDTKGV